MYMDPPGGVHDQERGSRSWSGVSLLNKLAQGGEDKQYQVMVGAGRPKVEIAEPGFCEGFRSLNKRD